MADIRCTNCGKNNPDFLDVCQFCQTPLKPESMVHIGENPVKKNTGELEPILPQWLKDVRQQARDSAEADAAEEASKPKVQKSEAPDLLAGLASQGRADDDEIPDWLASINPVTKPTPVETPSPAPETDFFAQFNKSEPKPAPMSEPTPENVPSWMSGATETPQAAEEKDELSEWLAKASEESNVPIEVESDSPDWMNQSDTPSYSFKEPAPPQKEEDLGWLHTLEDSSKEGAQPIGQEQMPFESPQIPSDGGDLGWLNRLGGEAVTPSQPEQASSPAPSDDLNWLNDLGGVEAAASNQSAQAEPAAQQEDLSWLNALGGASDTDAQESTSTPAPQADNLDWLNNLGGQDVRPFEEKPASGDLGWLKNLDSQPAEEAPPESASPFVRRRTGSLEEDAKNNPMPDWLKDATQEPSMPPPGAISEWFRDANADAAPPSAPQPASADSNLFNASGDSQSLSNQDVDSLFSVDMPEWLSRPEQGATETPSQPGALLGGDSLVPADLPSWVQSMRPVESVIAETTGAENPPTEREGPLAGLSGVIPIAPIGSSRRPKAISLKLQASDEQQAGAELLERILSSETNPKTPGAQITITTPLALRWLLTGLFLVVLGAMAYLRSVSMPVSAILPEEVTAVSSTIARLPQNSLILVVIDYEPALASEMEAVSGPMLDQLALSTRARLAFISTSPNGTALVRRLLTNTGISVPAPNGLDYKQGENYINLGYLPGGFSGVREFIESPNTIKPQAGVTNFTDYAAVLVLTDHAESGRVWVEQLEARKQADTTFFSFQPLLFAASAQAGPMLKPYFSSDQITGMVSGLADAVQYEFINNSRPGIARRYWDSYGVGILMAVVSIVIGGLWNFVSGLRARRGRGEAG